MDQDWKIKGWEEEDVFTHIGVAHHRFRNFKIPDYHQVAQVAFAAEGAPVLVQVQRWLCASGMSADSLRCHFGEEGSRPWDCVEPLLGVFLLQHLRFMPRVLNTTLHLFLDLGARFHDKVLNILYWGARKPFSGLCGHSQRNAHVGLLYLYPTTLPYNSSLHVGNLQEISCL